MQEVTYDINSLRDLIPVGQIFQLEGVLDSMRDYSSKGHPIVIEETYSNAPSHLIARLMTLDEVNTWIQKTFPGLSRN